MLNDSSDSEDYADRDPAVVRYAHRFIRHRVERLDVFQVLPQTPESDAIASVSAREMALQATDGWRRVKLHDETMLDGCVQVPADRGLRVAKRELSKSVSKRFGLLNEAAVLKSLMFVPSTAKARTKLAARLRELADDIEVGWNFLDDE